MVREDVKKSGLLTAVIKRWGQGGCGIWMKGKKHENFQNKTKSSYMEFVLYLQKIFALKP